MKQFNPFFPQIVQFLIVILLQLESISKLGHSHFIKYFMPSQPKQFMAYFQEMYRYSRLSAASIYLCSASGIRLAKYRYVLWIMMKIHRLSSCISFHFASMMYLHPPSPILLKPELWTMNVDLSISCCSKKPLKNFSCILVKFGRILYMPFIT